MGSLCKSGPATTTTSTKTKSESAYTPFARDEMQDIYGRVWEAGSTPYTPFTGNMVAGLNPTQLGGIDKITGATNYLNTAANYAREGAAPISDWEIERYINPFTNNVIDATRANFAENNAQQQSQIRGNAALRGALGGDRAGIAQAEAARQQKLAQDPIIAKMQQDSYTQALAAAQADRAAKAQGAYGFGALHSGALAGGQSQIGAGSLEQGVDQARLNAQYQEFMRAQQYPYQNAQFLASAGLPLLTAQGGTQTGQSSGTSTQVQQAAQPSVLQQAVGLGTAAIGAFSGNPFAFLGGLNSAAGGMPSTGATYGVSPGSSGMASFGGVPYPVFNRGGRVRPGYRNGGFIDRVNELRQAMRRGGAIRLPGYADGGEIPFWERFAPAAEAVQSGEFDPQGSNYPAPMAMAPEAPAESPALARGITLPPQIASPGGSGPIMAPAMRPAMQPAIAQAPMAADAPTDFSAQRAFPPRAAAQPGGGLSEEARMALIAAGLGMMASKHPNAAGAIGEGGLIGIKQYTSGKQTKEKNELAARKLLMDAEQFAKTHDLRGKTLDETKRYHDMTIQERREAASERSQDRRDALARHAFPGTGKDEDGNAVPGMYRYDPDKQDYVFKPGAAIQKGGSGSGRPPAVLQIADAMIAAREEARKANPSLPPLSREEAIKSAQRAPRDREDVTTRERLAQNLAKNDPSFTIDKAREFYGLPPRVMPDKKPAEKGLWDRMFGGGDKKADAPKLKPMTPEVSAKAKEAIDAGKDRNAVIQRLRENGIDPSGL